MQSRRNFIKQGCLACLGLSGVSAMLSSCGSTQNIVNAEVNQRNIKVTLDKFLTSNAIIVRNKKLSYDILVIKQGEEYSALEMRCTHNDIALTFSGKKLVCNAHGSEFDLKGKVMKAPAERSLTTYKTMVSGQELIIQLV